MISLHLYLLGLVQKMTLISMVTYHDTSFTLKEVYSKLLTCETRIQYNNRPLSLPTTFANIVASHNTLQVDKVAITQQLPKTGDMINSMTIVVVVMEI